MWYWVEEATSLVTKKVKKAEGYQSDTIYAIRQKRKKKN